MEQDLCQSASTNFVHFRPAVSSHPHKILQICVCRWPHPHISSRHSHHIILTNSIYINSLTFASFLTKNVASSAIATVTARVAMLSVWIVITIQSTNFISISQTTSITKYSN